MGEKKTFQGSTISLITQLFGTFMSGQACIAMLLRKLVLLYVIQRIFVHPINGRKLGGEK